MKLYGYPTAPVVLKAIYALEATNTPYEHDELFPWAERERLTSINPASKVPVLELDGKMIPESTDITVALDAKFPAKAPLVPSDAAAKAAVLDTLAWVEGAFPAAIGGPLIYQRVIRTHYAKEEPDTAAVAAALSAIPELYGKAEEKVPGAGFLCGDVISLADVSMWSWMRGAEVGGCKVCAKATPKLAAWYQRMGEDEVCQRANRKYSASAAVKAAIEKKY